MLSRNVYVTDDLEKVVSYMLLAKYKTPLILHTYCTYLIRNKAHCNYIV